MSTFIVRQLSLFDNPDPLPLQVAKKYQFPLDIQVGGGLLYYRAIDWLTGLVDERYARQTIKDLRKKTGLFSDPKWEDSIHSSQEADSRNRLQKVEYVRDELLYRLTIRVRETVTGNVRVSEIHDFLASAGAWIDEARREPEKAAQSLMQVHRQREVVKLKAAGYSEHEAVQALEERYQGVDTFKQLMTLVNTVCDAPNYPMIANAENVAMFGKIASELKIILNTKSVRDGLPALQLSYLRTAELALMQFMRHSDRLTMPEILRAIETIVKPLGEHLKTVCDMMGVDHITGKPLLKANNYEKEDEV